MNSNAAGRPYPGARPFRRADQDRFFGRTADAAVVAGWWRNSQVTYITGPAGRGKTSLLQAGVLPLLCADKRHVLPVGRLSYGAAFPSAGFPDHNPYSFALMRSWDPAETAARLVRLALHEFVRAQAGDGILFAAIDQADELLAATSQRLTYRRAFLGELRKTMDSEPRLHLLVAGREEAIGIARDVLGGGNTYDVPELSWENAVDAVQRPLDGTRWSFTDEAADRLLTDLQTRRIASALDGEHYVTDDRIEPGLLQVACSWLWDSLPAGLTSISARDIRRYGDVDTALSAYCGQIIAQTADDHDLPPKQLASWLLATFVTELGTRGKAYEGKTTAKMPNTVARALEDRHLLTSGLESRVRWYEVLSDRLIDPLRNAVVSGSSADGMAEPADLLHAAEHALTLGELELAERYAQDIVRAASGPDLRVDAAAHSLLGNLAHERGDPKEAEARYREAAQQYAAAGDTRALAFQIAAIGQMLLAQGRVAEAIEELHGAVIRQPNEPVLQTEFAQALWQDDKGTAAVAVLNDVLRRDGANLTALRARGEILAYLGEAREAIRDLERVSPEGQPSISAARGLALARLGDKAAARRAVEDALDKGPRNGPVLLYAARTFALSGDDISAQEFAEQAATATDPPLSPPQRAAARQLASRR